MRLNPILNKELTIGARSIKMSIHLMIYNLIMGAIAIVTMMMLENDSRYGGADYQTLMALFPILATVQCFIILFMIPILTASSIAGERERQTLDVMLTTPVRPMSIVLGKVMSAMAQVLMYVVSSVPIMSLAFIIGGMPWSYVFGFIAMVIYASFYVGAVGVYCSAKRKKTITSVISSFIIIGVVMIATCVIFFVSASIKLRNFYTYNAPAGSTTAMSNWNFGLTPLWMLLNPAVPVANYVVKAYFGYSIADLGVQYKSNLSTVMYALTQHWNVVAVIVNLLVALLFCRLAARKINPLRKMKKHPASNQPEES